MRTLEELIDTEDAALPLVQEWAAGASHPFEILEPSEADRQRVLLALQVTTRSTMGAVAHDTGGLLIDHGWLRVLGSGHPKLARNIVDWNEERSSGFLLVADDVVGGFFALNGGGLGEDAGAMYYWAPETLRWESLEIGYSDFLEWRRPTGCRCSTPTRAGAAGKPMCSTSARTSASTSFRSSGRRKARCSPVRARR